MAIRTKRTGHGGVRVDFSSVLLFIVTIAAAAADSNLIHTLPGFPGILPFKLETGYIGVGENGEHQLFYYFVESEIDPIEDPLVLWFTGGPGCSGFSGLVYEIGPLSFDLSSFDGSLPTFTLNPYSWTKMASIIFIDAPVGTGFSYSNVPESYHMNDTRIAMDDYMFLRKWLLSHPSFIKNRLYVGGDSYGGKSVPMVALHIAAGIEAGLQPQMNLQGYFTGNPLADVEGLLLLTEWDSFQMITMSWQRVAATAVIQIQITYDAFTLLDSSK